MFWFINIYVKKDNGIKNCKDYGKKICKGLIDLVDFLYLV